ncbi:MAG: hypothetical protein N2255_04025 [Kiritimatiellae bacterium]|nr:hypothetical protein [Kiritimatiellia bacterium]
MGTGRKYRKLSIMRPKKSGAARRRRDKVQRLRLISLGMPEDAVRRMTISEVRAMLRRPAQVAKRTTAHGA